jgi:NDP-sugar pyrophosphorylase family protein
MIFAAGLGTRLGPLGRTTPKALIDVGGKTMLERTARRLADAGAERIVVNVHHQAEAIERFLAEHDLGAEIVVSREPDCPLETGGGLLHARSLFLGGSSIVLHNVDVITDADLRDMVAFHERVGGIVTLGVNERESPRALLFDDAGLFGREDRRRDLRVEGRTPRSRVRRWAFAGIHVCAPELLGHITERGVFSILDVYLRLAGEGRRIVPYPLTGGLWLEIGDAERLERARASLRPPSSC